MDDTSHQHYIEFVGCTKGLSDWGGGFPVQKGGAKGITFLRLRKLSRRVDIRLIVDL